MSFLSLVIGTAPEGERPTEIGFGIKDASKPEHASPAGLGFDDAIKPDTDISWATPAHPAAEPREPGHLPPCGRHQQYHGRVHGPQVARGGAQEGRGQIRGGAGRGATEEAHVSSAVGHDQHQPRDADRHRRFVDGAVSRPEGLGAAWLSWMRGPTAGDHVLAITLLGAVNTVTAGVLALVKRPGAAGPAVSRPSRVPKAAGLVGVATPECRLDA